MERLIVIICAFLFVSCAVIGAYVVLDFILAISHKAEKENDRSKYFNEYLRGLH